jgi:hypothetical protein
MKKPSKPIGQIMAESVRAEHKGWPLDPTYPENPSHESGFKDDGDNQRVLWQIYDCAEHGEPIPPWAATAFREVFEKVMSCKLTWEEAFGKVPASREHTKPWLRNLAAKLPKIGEAVEYTARKNERGKPPAKDEEMRRRVGKKLGLHRGLFIEFYRRWKRANRS